MRTTTHARVGGRAEVSVGGRVEDILLLYFGGAHASISLCGNTPFNKEPLPPRPRYYDRPILLGKEPLAPAGGGVGDWSIVARQG